MLTNRSMPACTIIPVLSYPNVLEAARWLCGTFGFTMRLRIADHRVQLNAGDGAIVLTAQRAVDGKQRGSIMMRVPDVDQHHEHAWQHGACVLSPPADYPYGERQYTVEDPAGYAWTFSQSIRDVDPVEWGASEYSPAG